MLAFLFGLAIGYDRKTKDKPIGYQSYAIIAITTCLLAIMSQELYLQFKSLEDFTLDLGKVISGVLTGIGFLGAGAIIKRDDTEVIGTATGASIWAAGGIGLMLGFGFYVLSFLGFVSILLTLHFLPKIFKG